MAVLFFGALDWIRTGGLQSRSLTLYPSELQAHIYSEINHCIFVLHIKSEQHYVAVLHNIILALGTDFAFFLCCLH